MPATRAAADWLAIARAQLLRGEIESAQYTLAQALAEYPASIELRRARAGVEQQAGHLAQAEALLLELLRENAGDAASAFSLARMLKEQGRTAAAAAAIRKCLAGPTNRRDADLAISAIELLDDCNRKADAAAIAAVAIDANPVDPRLHAYAGMLQIQLGEFEHARQHYLFALEHDERAWEWHTPIGLSSAQRYTDGAHPDFAMFRDGLRRDNLTDAARAELHFALGKACDDIGDYEPAARQFRAGNAIKQRLTTWSRKAWRRGIEVRLAARPIAQIEPCADFVPVFIVGMPRSGTTLLAELLSRHPKVCNRGELPWIARLAEQPALGGHPDRASLRDAAARYVAQARQDDAGDARWFLDKQPLNFRYLDLMLAMFPHAKIVRCVRDLRDTAMSLWMQCFLDDVQGYSYDFGDIAQVMRDCDRLMSHWHERFPDSIHAIHYEALVSNPGTVTATLAQWVGLQQEAIAPPPTVPTPSISTASLWQARQPVNTRSIGHWQHYSPYLPELQALTGYPETGAGFDPCGPGTH
ncbi:MAG: sulfotransferase [Proteobacteria bacterium]|nr:sulfotransferase [Pseudomonadota bacterium]